MGSVPTLLIRFTFSPVGVGDGMSDLDKLHDLCKRTYKEQAVWYLNAFWEQHESEAERLWAYVLLLNELDLEFHEEGSALDEMKGEST